MALENRKHRFIFNNCEFLLFSQSCNGNSLTCHSVCSHEIPFLFKFELKIALSNFDLTCSFYCEKPQKNGQYKKKKLDKVVVKKKRG